MDFSFVSIRVERISIRHHILEIRLSLTDQLDAGYLPHTAAKSVELNRPFEEILLPEGRLSYGLYINRGHCSGAVHAIGIVCRDAKLANVNQEPEIMILLTVH